MLPMSYAFFLLGGTDFDQIDTTVRFSEGSGNGARSCFNVTIRNDRAFEKDQYFSLRITAFEDNVHILVDTFDIHIHDDDRKWFYVLHHRNHSLVIFSFCSPPQGQTTLKPSYRYLGLYLYYPRCG